MTTDDFPKNPKDFFTYAKTHQAEMVAARRLSPTS